MKIGEKLQTCLINAPEFNKSLCGSRGMVSYGVNDAVLSQPIDIHQIFN